MNSKIITQLCIPTGEIRVGDVVLTHGMRVRIDEIRTYEDHGAVYACLGTVLNLDEVRAAGVVPPELLRAGSASGPLAACSQSSRACSGSSRPAASS
jgi:hypothetical protein